MVDESALATRESDQGASGPSQAAPRPERTAGAINAVDRYPASMQLDEFLDQSGMRHGDHRRHFVIFTQYGVDICHCSDEWPALPGLIFKRI